MTDWVPQSALPGGSVRSFLERSIKEGASRRVVGRVPVGDRFFQWMAVVDGAGRVHRRVLLAFSCPVQMVQAVLPGASVRVAGNMAVVAAPSAEDAMDIVRRVVSRLGGSDEDGSVAATAIEPGSTSSFWADGQVEAPAPVPPRRVAEPELTFDSRNLTERHRHLAQAMSTAFESHAASFAASKTEYEAATTAHTAAHAQGEQAIQSKTAQLDATERRAQMFLTSKARGYMWEQAVESVSVESELDLPYAKLLAESEAAANATAALLERSKVGRRKIAEDLAAYLSTARAAVDAWSVDNARLLGERIAASERKSAEQRRAATDLLDRELARIGVDLSSFERDLAAVSPSWEGADWERWGARRAVPHAVRFGRVLYFHADRSAVLSAVLGLPGGKPLVHVFGTRRVAAISSLQSIIFRLLASFPPGKLQFLFVDPVGLGQTVAPFLHLADYDEKLVGGKVWSEPSDIEARLADTTSHIELVIQKYLRSQYATIEEHNEVAGEVAEAYRFLVVADFPVNFTETAAKRLVSIMENGPRCGVYPLVLVNPSKPLPYGFSLSDLTRSATVVTATDANFQWNEPHMNTGILELESAPELTIGRDGSAGQTLFKRVVEGVGAASRESAVVEVSAERVFAMMALARRAGGQDDLPETSRDTLLDDPGSWWSGSTARGLSAPIGRKGAHKVQCLALGHGVAQHVLVVGKTGSGKSTLLHALVTSLAMLYSPEEFQLYLVDLKQGVEFKCYADAQLPHARVVAINSERQFALSVLRGLDEEMRHRGELFRAAGVEDLAGHRRTGAPKLPRILLVVDEFHEIYSEEDQISAEAATLLDRLLRQGRAFGVHAVLGSQTLSGLRGTVTRSMSQIAVRIALQCSADDSRLILAEDNPAARLLGRPGEAIYNAANGRPEANEPFQVVWLPDGQRDELLAAVQDRVRYAGGPRGRGPMVFEGNAAARLADNRALAALLSNATAHAGADASVWLGEPLAISEPVQARFTRQSAANLLVVGRDAILAQGLVASALVALAAHPETESVDVVDFTPLEAGFSDFVTRLTAVLPHVRNHRRRQFDSLLDATVRDVQGRLDSGRGPRRYLVLHGLGQARDLATDDYEDDAVRRQEAMTAILRDGPECGIHTIAWTDSLANLDRRLRNPLREFALRVGAAMSREESSRLLESPAAAHLRDNQACLYNEDRSTIEAFRAYALPDLGWVARQRQGRRG